MRWRFERHFDTVRDFLPFVIRAAEHYGCKARVEEDEESARVEAESKSLKAHVKIREKTLESHPFRRSLGPIKALDVEIEAEGEDAQNFYERIIILSLRAFC